MSGARDGGNSYVRVVSQKGLSSPCYRQTGLTGTCIPHIGVARGQFFWGRGRTRTPYVSWPRKGQVNFYKRTSAGHAQLGDHPDMILLTATAHANAHIGTEGLPVKCWVVLDAPPPAPPPPPPPPICGVSTTVLDRQLPSPHLTPTSAPLPLPSLQRMGRKG